MGCKHYLEIFSNALKCQNEEEIFAMNLSRHYVDLYELIIIENKIINYALKLLVNNFQ